MKRTIRESLLLLALSLVLTFPVLIFHPSPPNSKVAMSGGGKITVEEVQFLDSVLWLDVRTKAAFQKSHISGAHWYDPNDSNAFEELIIEWDGFTPIVIYCDGGGCALSKMIRNQLSRDLGTEQIYYLEGGFAEWND